MQHVEITERLDETQVPGCGDQSLETEAAQVVAGARMHGKHQGETPLDLDQGAQDPFQGGGRVDVGLAVQSDHPVLPRDNPQVGENARLRRPGLQPAQGVDHQVADPVNAARRNVLGEQVGVGILGVGVVQVRGGGGRHAVDLLRQAPVSAAQPRLDMGKRDVADRGRHGACQGAGDVTYDDHEIRLLPLQDLVEAGDNVRNP